MSAFFAFLHHLAAFALVGALVAEFVLLRADLNAHRMRQLLRADMVYGLSAGFVLIVGTLRLFHFEKGADYYFHSLPFIVKALLFVLIALLSIYPTVQFVSWRKALRRGEWPALSEDKLRKVRALVHWQLAALVPLILCAALMARGIGLFG
jgi:putative membrane protein